MLNLLKRSALFVVVSGIAFSQSFTVGSKAPNFTLKDSQGASVSLADENAKGPVVLVVLRGFPGYQCPFCTKQFADLLAHAGDFESAGATVLLVYPGSADAVKQHAEEFLASRPMPSNFHFLVDPDLQWVTAHGLHWAADHETSYPSTYVIDRSGEVRFATVAKAHGSRVGSATIMESLGAMKAKKKM